MRHEMIPFGDVTPLARQGAADRPFAMLQSRLHRLLDDMWRDAAGMAPVGADGGLYIPRIDMSEDESNVYVSAELPGLSEKDLEVEFADGQLRIAGEKTAETTDEGRTYRLAERSHGRFERLIPVAAEIDRERVDAHFRDGVLTVTLPKTETGRSGRRIEVRRDG